MNKLLVLIIVLFVVGWVMYDSWQPTGNENEIKSSVEVIIDTKQDIIVVDTPLKDMTISSPFVVSGKARGYWFFEASFPIELRDMQGNILETIIAQADGDWMTTEFVPFTASLIFTKPSVPISAVLVFKKDNPSGLPENDDSIEIPVTIQ